MRAILMLIWLPILGYFRLYSGVLLSAAYSRGPSPLGEVQRQCSPGANHDCTQMHNNEPKHRAPNLDHKPSAE
ncbi:hypothetical protein BDV09DRAFT_166282 [Aspergillus tetrazonus]